MRENQNRKYYNFFLCHEHLAPKDETSLDFAQMWRANSQ